MGEESWEEQEGEQRTGDQESRVEDQRTRSRNGRFTQGRAGRRKDMKPLGWRGYVRQGDSVTHSC